VKNIASGLRPGVLDELGLAKTLKSEAREFEGHTGIQCRFKTNTAKAKFDRSAAVAIFRIVQAALTNVARHAHASRAVIALMKRKDGLILTVMDNGKGITTKLVDSHASLGNYRHARARPCPWGYVCTRGLKRQGDNLTVRIPLSRILDDRVGV